MAASSLTVDCGAVLGWHGTLPAGAEGAASLATEGGPDALVGKYREWLEKFHRDERNFYSRAGVDYKILEYANQKVKISSGKVGDYKFNEKTGEYSYSSTPSVWVPQRVTLEKYKIDGGRYCRKYTEKMVQDVMDKAGVKSSFVLDQ
ncbi:hypothetical protein WCN79_16565 [Xanthomonas axonopodis pv. vasculorum]